VADLLAPDELVPLLEVRGRDFPPERERGERLGRPPEQAAWALADALQPWLRK
jgi:hypothetical protein